MRFKSFVASAVAISLCSVVGSLMFTDSKQASAEQSPQPDDSRSYQLYLKFEEAKSIAGQQIKDLDLKSLSQGSNAPYTVTGGFSTSPPPHISGIMISFIVSGTYRREKLSDSAEKVIVLFPDSPYEKVTAARMRIPLKFGVPGLTK